MVFECLTPLPKVLNIHNIKFVVVNGNRSLQERQKAITAFREASADGPRVLILSNVGTAGLNLAFACIIVCLVRLRLLLDRRSTR